MASHAVPVKTATGNDSDESSLNGRCSCGRNHYAIYLPDVSPSLATLVIDTSITSRQTHSTPLPTFLRVPLRSLRSTTHAFYPDESHSQIRRVFTPSHAPRTKRHFCGFCGTELSFWREDSVDRHVEEWVCVNLGTLEDEAVELLEEKGILGDEAVSIQQNAEAQPGRTSNEATLVRSSGRVASGQPWFEELIRDTKIGRIREARGGQISQDGTSKVSWQVVEFDGEAVDGYDDKGEDEVDISKASPGKRKAEDMED